MPVPFVLEKRLSSIPGLTLLPNEPLSKHTRFAIGGPAGLFVVADDRDSFLRVLKEVRASASPHLVIGGGTNLVVSDDGYEGLVLKTEGSNLLRSETNPLQIWADAGASLQAVVDWTIAAGLRGMETLTGIPGSLGGAVYGNAGAYGRSMHELVQSVLYTDGVSERELSNQDCQFSYRESIFKERKDWIVLGATLQLSIGYPAELQATAHEIRTVRDRKYPPDMKCAGSIFKNLFFAELPEAVQRLVPPAIVREGKVPSAWFLEQTGARGLRIGDIEVAPYHANLIYNLGSGTSADLVSVISELKSRVFQMFDFLLAEEVQFVGFDFDPTAPVLTGTKLRA
jgi:UDP-N-acetylmuramate dehydrogenase